MKTLKPIIIEIPIKPNAQAIAKENVIVILHNGTGVVPVEGLLHISEFHENQQGGWIAAAQAHNKLWGYISEKGEWLISPALEDARNFSNGTSRFRINERWGFINTQAEIIIEPKFLYANPFYCGVTTVDVDNSSARIIDLKGNFTCAASFKGMFAFGKNGLAPAIIKLSKKPTKNIGYVNHLGEWVIPESFCDANSFGDYNVAVASKKEGFYGLINEEGKWILEPKFKKIAPFNELGLARYGAADDLDYMTHALIGRNGYLNTQGVPVIANIDYSIYLEKEIPCGILRLDRKYLKINGEELQVPSLCASNSFLEGLNAAICSAYTAPRKAEWGMLDTEGEFRTVPEDILEPVSDNYGAIAQSKYNTPAFPFITKDNQICWLDSQAKKVWRAEYSNSGISLFDDTEKLLWRSNSNASYQPPAIHFNAPPAPLPPAEDFYINIKKPSDIVEFAYKLIETAELRLHRLAKGETLDYTDQNLFENPGYRFGDYFDHEYEEIFEESEEDLEEAGLTLDHLQSFAVCERQQVMRAYLSEDENDDAIRDHLFSIINPMQSSFIAELSKRFGPPDTDPEYVSFWGYDKVNYNTLNVAWRIPLKNTIAEHPLEESHEQWLTIFQNTDGSGGDNIFSIWLMAAPSKDAINLAINARNIGSKHSSEQTFNFDSDKNTLQKDSKLLKNIPREHLTDELIEAALTTNKETIKYVPKRFMTPERYVIAIQEKHKHICQVPQHFLTEEACLAAVKLHGYNLKDIPLEWRTLKVCTLAKKSSPHVTDYIPEHIAVLMEKINTH